MIQFTKQLQEQLKDQLLNIEEQSGNMLRGAESSIALIQSKLEQMKNFIANYKFSNVDEEIYFFKEVKPDIDSKLIYFLRIFNIESKKPENCSEVHRELISKELKEISLFFEHNLEFYQYYSNKSTYLDERYFIRGNYDLQMGLDDYSLLIDANFSTPHSYKVARIKAYEMLGSYLNDQTKELDIGETAKSSSPNPELKWTASKTDLIELIYAFQTNGVFNNGNADLKQIASFFEKQLGFELGDFYRIFQFIRIRKSSRTSFLDQLKTQLVKRMDETDENPRFSYR